MNHLLIVGAADESMQLTRTLLQKEGYLTSTAEAGNDALNFLQDTIPDMILLDIVLPDIDGMDICRTIRAMPNLKETPILCVSSQHDLDSIRKCFAAGGTDLISKPVRDYDLLTKVTVHFNIRKKDQVIQEIQTENNLLKCSLFQGELNHPGAFAGIKTISPRMRSLFIYIEAIAGSSRPTLITGETGVGKELIAKVIHTLSNRPGQFVGVNVAGLDDTMFADTLFGHERGAFTEVEKTRSGLIETAENGTLFLNEIGDLGPESQVKLLRLIQQHEYYPLGSDYRQRPNTRLVVATHQHLPTLVKNGQFREDLMHRLNSHHLEIPPLRERKEDIRILTRQFIANAVRELGIKKPIFPESAWELLEAYDYPGNIRELEAIIFDAVSRSQGKTMLFEALEKLQPTVLSSTDSPRSQGPSTGVFGIETLCGGKFPTLKEMNQWLIDAALGKAHGNFTKAAQLLGLTRQALYKRLAREEGNEE